MTGSVGLAGGSPPGLWVPGLCSVTFRALAVPAVVDLAAEAGLEAIEWGGDVHVPPGDVRRAAAAAQATLATGLRVGSYGSYLFAGADLDADDVAARSTWSRRSARRGCGSGARSASSPATTRPTGPG
ncbi:MAG: hypothetical protein R2690_15535 [Acidimicrobiales bacterium]